MTKSKRTNGKSALTPLEKALQIVSNHKEKSHEEIRKQEAHDKTEEFLKMKLKKNDNIM